jgi:hypothetical protein
MKKIVKKFKLLPLSLFGVSVSSSLLAACVNIPTIPTITLPPIVIPVEEIDYQKVLNNYVDFLTSNNVHSDGKNISILRNQ